MALHIVTCDPNPLHRIKCRHGQVQLVIAQEHVVLDVQGRDRGVDGVDRGTHAATVLDRAQAEQLRDALSRFITRQAVLERAA